MRNSSRSESDQSRRTRNASPTILACKWKIHHFVGLRNIVATNLSIEQEEKLKAEFAS
jgi:hypothetical protein